jgi:hypothetical protein
MFDRNRVNLLSKSSSAMASLGRQSLNKTRLKPPALRNTEIGQGRFCLCSEIWFKGKATKFY